jgi:hypothetical protein
MLSKRSFFLNALHIFVLNSFVIGQPLFDLLSKNAEFLIAHKATPIDIFSLILVLCILIPALFVVLEFLVGKIHPNLGKYCHSFFIGIFLSAIALQVLNRVVEFPGIILVAGAIVLGAVGVSLYVRFSSIRLYLTILSPAILAFPILFVFNSPVQKIVFPDQHTSVSSVKGVDLPPIIMVIFDEFPISALMDEHRQIDPVRYPNFSKLAQTSYWFRNYTTVGERTTAAIPSILTGIYPKTGRLPTSRDYPKNLFTFLDSSYEMVSHEPDTMMCPSSICVNKSDINHNIEGLRSVLLDLSVVYLHILLPPDLARSLPPVSLTWTNFLRNTRKSDDQRKEKKHPKCWYGAYDRGEVFNRFVNTIDVAKKPNLYVFHSRLPHIPWEYLPSGKFYKHPGLDTPGLNYKTDLWCGNEWLVIQGYQRHLLQIGFMDKLLGNLVERFKTINLYDKALIIITADHGISFWPNQIRRLVYQNKPMDIMSVPFFMKIPHQKKGEIMDRNVESIDILPTISQIINMPLPWKVDGESMLHNAKPERPKKIIYNYRHEKFVFNDTKDFYESGLVRKLSIFGSGSKPYGLYNIGAHRELFKRHISDINVAEKSDITINFNKEFFYTNIDLESSFIPTQIRGNIHFETERTGPLDFAISINNVIYATTKSFAHKKNTAQFSGIVPESAFRMGKNDLNIFLISKNNGEFLLIPCNHNLPHTFALKRSEKHGEVIMNGKKAIPVVSKKIKGRVDSSGIKKDRIFFQGWAANVLTSQSADHIVVFINGQFLFSSEPSIERPDVVAYFKDTQLKISGFSFSFPLSIIKKFKQPKIRLFAVSNNISSELSYHQKYRWN